MIASGNPRDRSRSDTGTYQRKEGDAGRGGVDESDEWEGGCWEVPGEECEREGGEHGDHPNIRSMRTSNDCMPRRSRGGRNCFEGRACVCARVYMFLLEACMIEMSQNCVWFLLSPMAFLSTSFRNESATHAHQWAGAGGVGGAQEFSESGRWLWNVEHPPLAEAPPLRKHQGGRLRAVPCHKMGACARKGGGSSSKAQSRAISG